MEQKNTRMAPSNLVAMLLFVGSVGGGVGLILGPSFEVIGGAPAWTRGVFLACWVSSGLLLMLDKNGSIADLKPLGLSLLALVLLMAVSGVREDDAPGMGADFSDLDRAVTVYIGLVLSPVVSVLIHVGEILERWKTLRSS
jgi:hypothetical protein